MMVPSSSIESVTTKGQLSLISMISGALETRMVQVWRNGFEAALSIKQETVRRKYQISIHP